MPSCASATWQRTFSASATSAFSCALSLALLEARYLSAIGISRAKWGNRSKSSLGHMALVYVFGQHRRHRSRAPAPPQQHRHHARQQNRRNNTHRLQAIDAPLVNHVGLEVAEKRGTEKTDARQFEHDPNPSPDREYPNQAVSDNPDDRYGNVHLVGMQLSVLVKFIICNRREDRIFPVVHSAAVPVLRNRTRRRRGRIHVVHVQRQRTHHDARYRKKCNQVFHALHLTSATRLS